MITFCIGVIIGDFLGVVIMSILQINNINKYEAKLSLLEERNKRLENIIINKEV